MWYRTEGIPLDFSSIVHPFNSSCTSSASTLVRVHASDHFGFAGRTCDAACCPFFDLVRVVGPSLPFSLEKKPAIFLCDRSDRIVCLCYVLCDGVVLEKELESHSRSIGISKAFFEGSKPALTGCGCGALFDRVEIGDG